MKLIKKDFIPSGAKSILDYPLPSGKAYYIETVNGIEYGSDSYVREEFEPEERLKIIDFTSGMIASFEKKIIFTINKGGASSNNQKNTDRYKAILYIYLHEEKMNKFNLPKCNKFLTSIYKHHQDKGFLSDKQVEAVLKIEQNQRRIIKKEFKTKTLKNLLTCYAYEYKIKRALEVLDDDKKEYMDSMLVNLYENLYLTDNQIIGMFNWFQFLPKDLSETKLKQFDKLEQTK
ncbi:hypothetical protein QIW49_01600 [Francisellaceae bacterium CB300]